MAARQLMKGVLCLWWMHSSIFQAQPLTTVSSTDSSLSGHNNMINMTQFFTRINQTLDSIVDATLDHMNEVYHAGNLCPFKHKVASKLHRGESLVIQLLGGSVTYGADLRDRMKERWSYSFTEIMNSGWYKGNKIEVYNEALAACNVDVWINMVSKFKRADLVIVDLSVNDQGFDLQSLPMLYHSLIQQLDNLPNHPAIMFHYAFRAAKDMKDINGHCPGQENYITCCGGAEIFCKKWWCMQDYVAITLQKFRVPFISYRDLVWPDYSHPPEVLNQFWNGLSHPDHKAHALMAKLIAFAFMKQLKEVHKYKNCQVEKHSRYVPSELQDNSTNPVCPSPLTYMQATDTLASKESFVVRGNPELNHWRFYNDSKMKFGYILESDKSVLKGKCSENTICEEAIKTHTLSLPISLSAERPIVQLYYLKSYAPEMGKVRVWLDENKADYVVIDGGWELRSVPYSVQHMATISAKHLLAVNTFVMGDNKIIPTLTGGSHTLHISIADFRGEKFKWKLLAVKTC